MTDKITKLLAKMPSKDLRRVRTILQHILLGEIKKLDVKMLKGQPNLYRARSGDYRIVFTIRAGHKPEIIAISRRNEQTYKEF